MQKAAAICLALAGLTGWGGAQAQIYNCRTSAGTNYQSARPCAATTGTQVYSNSSSSRNGSSSGSSVTYYGPTESDSRPRYQPPTPSVGEAPAHIRYMSPRCSSLHDALRTASARGLKHETVNEMRRGYQVECSEDEREAYTALSQERGEKNQQRRAEQSANMAQKERTALQQQQCGESKRILVTKRARTDLNEGEKAELQRFEDNYRARCS
ncbi:hypothetical protein [uncultured Ramlibacter sp.]|uniref:hypothetical protein n=1 Tax=uncultured Ramlibacter sp. TaxID=260755 RepID=UPI00263987A1|nr:hypothetical protein [uncultured Ramlibacter sp.]